MVVVVVVVVVVVDQGCVGVGGGGGSTGAPQSPFPVSDPPLPPLMGVGQRILPPGVSRR